MYPKWFYEFLPLELEFGGGINEIKKEEREKEKK